MIVDMKFDMKKLYLPHVVFYLCLLAGGTAVLAQTDAEAERSRISNERAQLEAGFNLSSSACYKKFLVNNCLDEIKDKRLTAMADLRRQEVSLDAEQRKVRGAEQIKKTDDKSSLEKQQQAADKRAESLKVFDSRMTRNLEKKTTLGSEKPDEKLNRDAGASRSRNAQDKQNSRNAKQAASAEELKKYNQRLENAQERQLRINREKVNQTKPAARPLPVPG